MEGSESFGNSQQRGSPFTLQTESHSRRPGPELREQGSTYRRGVTQLVFLAREDLPQNTPHDLAGPGLGQVRNDVHRLGRGEGADALPHLHDELLAERVVGAVALLEGDKSVDRLAGQLVRHTDDGCLADGVMLQQGGLDLGRRQAVARHVNHVINAATDPVETLMVTSGTVTGELRNWCKQIDPYTCTRQKVILT